MMPVSMSPTPVSALPFFSRLRVRVLLLVLVSLVPAMLLILYLASQQYREARVQVQDAALRLVRIAAADHARRFSAARRVLIALADSEEIRGSGQLGCAGTLSNMLSPETGFIDLQLIDASGKRLCAWPANAEPVTAAESALARHAIEARRFVAGSYEFVAATGHAEVHLAYPSGPIVGVPQSALLLSYDLSLIGNLIRSSGLPEGAAIALMNDQGVLLYRYPEPEKWVGKHVADIQPARSILGREHEGVIEIEGFDDVPRLFAFAPLRLEESGERIYVHVGIASAVAYKDVMLALTVALGGLGVVSMIVLVLAWGGGNVLIARPIGALVAAAKRLGSGDFGARSGVTHLSGEIGQLAITFDSMAEALQQRHFEVEQLKFAIDEHAIVSIAGLDGKITYVNDKFVEVSQYSREELLGQDHRILNSGYHDPAFFAELWRTIAGGLPWQGVIRNRSKNGNFYWVATTIVPVIGTDGRHHHYISLRTEVTQIKQTEESLRQNEAKFRGLAETMSSAVIVHREGKHLYANRYAEVLTGFSHDELLAMDFTEFVHPVSRQLVLERSEARLAGKPVPPHCELRLNTKDGRALWVELSAGIIQFDGQVSVIGTFTDITERRAAQQVLRDAHGELERLVEQRTEQVSAAKRDLEQDVMRRAKVEAELIERNAELSGLNQQLSDAQNQLMQSEKLASIGQLAAGIAHEINNPIGYVQSNLGSLGKYLDDLLAMLEAYESAEGSIGDAAALENVRRIKQDLDLAYLREDLPNLMHESNEGITRVRKIVQDLKDFSRVDSAQEWEFADLHRCLDSTLNVVSNELKYKADVAKEYGALPEVECLPSQLNQVFMNLMVNAAHAIEGPRGTITLRTGTAGDEVWVEVADTGKGIPPENLGRIFDPFFTTKPVGKGTGLGLSLSYGIVHKHNGRIEVASEPGKGTSFRISLPVRRAAVALAA